MQLAYLSYLSVALAAAAISAQEVHSGIKYEVRWAWDGPVETAPIKDAYESAAAEQATARIVNAVNAAGAYTDCVPSPVDPSVAGVKALKHCIVAQNPKAFLTLLADAFPIANAYWSNVIARSTTDRAKFVPARVWVRGYYGAALTAVQFATWTLSDDADAVDLDTNPEHYYKSTVVDALGVATSQIVEGWGGVLSPTIGTLVTNFTVPGYTVPVFDGGLTPGGYPTEWALDPSFNILLQRIGPKVLPDGQTFGYLHIAARDVPANTKTGEPAAVEIYAGVWYPPYDGASAAEQAEFVDNWLADEAHHIVVEIINSGLAAMEQVGAGRR
ncbi:hypothetical protein MKEN_00005300 [Mycena kentingensis (nom. inval.)]|nr:hypothetical protein MKEN_00005300 [Mycena kentingensis (nom. inval.)]